MLLDRVLSLWYHLFSPRYRDGGSQWLVEHELEGQTLSHSATTDGSNKAVQESESLRRCKQDLQEYARELNNLRTQLSLERRKAGEAVAAHTKERNRSQEELERMKQKYVLAVEERKKALEDVSKRDTQLERQDGQLRATRTSLSRAQELADARAQELIEAQTFLGSYDSFTDARIVSDVERLNAQIAQMASTLAAEVGDTDVVAHAGVGEDDAVKASEVLRAGLGFDVSHYLPHVRHDENPLLLESIIQACTLSVASRAISRWHPTNRLSWYMDNIFYHLVLKEPPSVSGRWRILTRQYAKTAFPSETDGPAPVFDALMSALSATLVVAGLVPSQGQAKAIVLAHVEVELRDIVGLVLELNTSIGDGVVSRSLFPVLASHGAVFDGPTMVDDYAGDAPASPEERIVLCTRGMGLRCIIGGGEVTSRLLVPPKIVLKSIVDMLPRVGEMMPLGSPRSAVTALATV